MGAKQNDYLYKKYFRYFVSVVGNRVLLAKKFHWIQDTHKINVLKTYTYEWYLALEHENCERLKTIYSLRLYSLTLKKQAFSSFKIHSIKKKISNRKSEIIGSRHILKIIKNSMKQWLNLCDLKNIGRQYIEYNNLNLIK